MEKKSNGRRVVQIIISILAALALWIYMEVYVSPPVRIEINNIPVEFTNEDTTLAENGLMLLSGYDATVDLELEGERKYLMRLDTEKVRIVADTSSITAAGVQTLEYDIIYPDDFPRSEVTVKNRSVYRVTVTVGKLHSKEIPIRTEINGQVADGYFTGDVQIDPTTLVLRAEREDMLNISYAKVSVNIGGATSTVIETVEYTLYDYNDVPVYNDNIRASTKLIQVTVPVRTTKEVPLSVDLVGAELMESVDVKIDPTSVVLVGEGSALESISKLTLDKIYVEDLVPGLNTFSYTIKLPAGISTLDGTKEAVVTVAINGTTEGHVTVENINCVGAADGLKAEVREPLQVALWGNEEEIAAVSASDVLVRVDVSDITTEGVYVLPAVVGVSQESGVAVRGSYEVTVYVTKRETTPDTGGGDTGDTGTDTGGGDSTARTPEGETGTGSGSGTSNDQTHGT
mgnify:CR=1 FL=1